MSPTLRAQLRDLGRWFWIHLVNRLAFALLLAIFQYYSTRYLRSETAEFEGNVVLSSFFLLSVLPAFAFTTRSWYICMDFTRPISTLQLVIVPLLLSVIVALVSFVIPASLFLWLLSTSFPLAGPSALVVCGVCCLFASLSTPATVAGRYAGATLTAVVIFILFVFVLATLERGSQDSQWIASSEAAFWESPWLLFVGSAVLSAMAIAISVLGVQRRRYGESIWGVLKIPAFRLSAFGRETRRGNRVASTRLLSEPFRNQWTAQCWYDFRKIRRWLLFPIFLVPSAFIAVVIIGTHVDPDVEACLATFAFSLVFCSIVYQILGAAATTGLRFHHGAVSLPSYDATVPMRCDHLIAMKLLLVTAWSLVGWLLMAGAVALYSPYIGDGLTWTKLSESLSATDGEVSADWWVAAAIIVTPLLMSISPLMLTFGYFANNPLHPLRGACGIIFVAVSFVLVVFELVGVWSYGDLWIVYSCLLPVVIIGWCASALKSSLESEFVGKPYFVVTLSLWALFVCMMIAAVIVLSPAIPSSIASSTRVSTYLIGVAVLLAPLAATLAAPMELASHRHG